MPDNLEDWAIKGIDQELENIKEQRIKLGEREEALLKAKDTLQGHSIAPPKQRTYSISPEGRRKISEAQKARWALKKKKNNKLK